MENLGPEKIDIVDWSADPAKFVAAALSPAVATGVQVISEKNQTAIAFIHDDQLSLAIGKEGQNARLAAKLTGWKIGIESAEHTPRRWPKRRLRPVRKLPNNQHFQQRQARGRSIHGLEYAGLDNPKRGGSCRHAQGKDEVSRTWLHDEKEQARRESVAVALVCARPKIGEIECRKHAYMNLPRNLALTARLF